MPLQFSVKSLIRATAICAIFAWWFAPFNVTLYHPDGTVRAVYRLRHELLGRLVGCGIQVEYRKSGEISRTGTIVGIEFGTPEWELAMDIGGAVPLPKVDWEFDGYCVKRVRSRWCAPFWLIQGIFESLPSKDTYAAIARWRALIKRRMETPIPSRTPNIKTLNERR